jgi:hypothetical protein
MRVAALDGGRTSAGGVGRAAAVSAASVVGLLVIEERGARELLERCCLFSVLMVAIATAVALDVVGELRALWRHGPLVPVWPEHRVYAVAPALEALEAAGIPALARSRHHRALWHFFAPHIPVQLLVPPAHADEARRLLQERLATPG